MSLTERVDPRVQRTRQAIEDAFQTLLSERGLATLTVHDITARAGVNRATFYAHYEDKHALFTHLIRRHFQTAVEAQLLQRLRFEAGDLRRLLMAVCLFMSQVYEGCHVHDDNMGVQIEQLVQGNLIAWLSEALDRSTPAPGAHLVSRQTLATLTAGSLYTAAAIWGQRKVDAPLAHYVSEVMVVIQGGLSACGLERV